MYSKVFISLGTNLGDLEHNLFHAIDQINSRCGNVKQKSSIYSSPPWGYESFNNYLNQVIEIETLLHPEELINCLLTIENEFGRLRNSNAYQDRIIDLDILFYNQLILKTPSVTLPHPSIAKRRFILEPMAEIDCNFIHPGFQKSIKVLLESTSDKSTLSKLH